MEEEKEEKKQMDIGKLVGAVILGVVIGYFLGAGRGAKTTDTSGTIKEGAVEFSMVNHIQAGMPEQDAFIEKEVGSGEVWRVEGEEAEDADILAQMVFATVEATGHDPFKLGGSPLGPFVKDEPLGFALGDWLAGSASGIYSVEGGMATIELSMTKLVPDGVYTVWCSRIKLPPNPAVFDLPCGAIDGSGNLFTADANGGAKFSMKMNPLQPSTETTANVIALAYHSDGKSNGVVPGDFGLNTHVQLFYIMPAPEAN